MRCPEGIVHIEVSQLCEGGAEGSDLVLAGLDFLAIDHTLALLGHVEPEVLQKEDLALVSAKACALYIRPHAIVKEGYFPLKEVFQGGQNRLHGILVVALAVGAAQVAH